MDAQVPTACGGLCRTQTCKSLPLRRSVRVSKGSESKTWPVGTTGLTCTDGRKKQVCLLCVKPAAGHGELRTGDATLSVRDCQELFHAIQKSVFSHLALCMPEERTIVAGSPGLLSQVS